MPTGTLLDEGTISSKDPGRELTVHSNEPMPAYFLEAFGFHVEMLRYPMFFTSGRIHAARDPPGVNFAASEYENVQPLSAVSTFSTTSKDAPFPVST